MMRLYRNWPVALIDRARVLPKRPILYQLRDETELLVMADTHDVQVINEIWIDHIYTPMAWKIQPDWTVIDLGAHRGVFSVFAGYQAKQVMSVEANPEAFSMCLGNLSTNGLLEKIKPFQGAIDNTDGKREFYVASDAGSSSIFTWPALDIERVITVPKIPMSRLLNDVERVDLLKIDIEGTEYRLILSSSSESWLQKVDRVVIEYHRIPGMDHSVSELIARLRKAGFHTTKRQERNLLYAERTSHTA